MKQKNRIAKYFNSSITNSTHLLENLENNLGNSLAILIEDDLPKKFIQEHKNQFNVKLKEEYKEELEQCLDDILKKLKTRALKIALTYNK